MIVDSQDPEDFFCGKKYYRYFFPYDQVGEIAKRKKN